MYNAYAYGWLFKDWLFENLLSWFAYLKYIIFFLLYPFCKSRAFKALMESHRYYPYQITEKIIRANVDSINEYTSELLDKNWIKNLNNPLDHISKRSIVLKWPKLHNSIIEKGVLLITFTTSFSYYYSEINIEILQKFFFIVLEPSWSGYCLPEILFWINYKNSPVIIQATEPRDYNFVRSLNSNLIPVDFGASNWVDFTIFYPLHEIKKEYDVIYVANFSSIKRHHVFFKAIKQINDPLFKAALVCGKWGDDKKGILKLIDYYKVNKNITIFEGISPRDVNVLLNQSKVNLLLSLKEGSNRSIFEAFFAGIPGIVLKNNIGVNKSYINEKTGKLINEEELVQTLLYFKNNWNKYTEVRDWAINNISPEVTTKKLEKILQSISLEINQIWSNGLFVKVNSPEVCYFHKEYKYKVMDVSDLLNLFSKSHKYSYEKIFTTIFDDKNCTIGSND